MILAGDIGGTKCNLALVDTVESRGGALEIVFLEHYPSADFPDFAALLETFRRDSAAALAKSQPAKILAAGFGVAGPILGESAHLTNLGWNIETAAIRSQLGTPHVALLNDLEATGYSLENLAPEAFCVLNAGAPAPRSTRAIIAAGTGLGEGILRWNGSRYVGEPSEGGHCDLAPRNEREIALLRHMKAAAFEPVSWEMVLSGRGFLVIHQFLDPSVTHPGFEDAESAAPEITRLALAGSCPVCVATLDLWTDLYGAEAGNLALKVLARGGVFVAGGIAPKILPKLRDGGFLRAFCAKEKFHDLLARIPIQVLLNEQAPLLGAAAEAARLASAAQ